MKNMMVKTCILFIALFSAGQSNPIGPTLCESQYLLPNVIPNPGSTTVCESTPNFLGFGLGLGPLGLNMLPLPNTGSTTLCESAQNVPYGLASLGPVNPFTQLPGSTTVCESTPNIVQPLNPYNVGSTSIPNMYGLQGLQGLQYSLYGGVPYGLTRSGLQMPIISGMPGLVGSLGAVPYM